jgi:excinuclease ABC subunit A
VAGDPRAVLRVGGDAYDGEVSISPVESSSLLSVRGARVHNLRDVDLDIPRDSLVVFTGLSGSGKSSLAFDTIFAEGQRRYCPRTRASSSARSTAPTSTSSRA